MPFHLAVSVGAVRLGGRQSFAEAHKIMRAPAAFLLLMALNSPASPATPPIYTPLANVHHAIDRQAPAGAVVFFGDSIIQRLYVSQITTDRALNFGLWGATSWWVNNLLQGMTTPRTARAAVVHVGTNDARYILAGAERLADLRANVGRILDAITAPTVLTGVHHTTYDAPTFSAAQRNEVIDQINAIERELCAARSHCLWVPSNLDDASGHVRPEFLDDGLHPSAAGYAQWAPAIAEGLRQLGAIP